MAEESPTSPPPALNPYPVTPRDPPQSAAPHTGNKRYVPPRLFGSDSRVVRGMGMPARDITSRRAPLPTMRRCGAHRLFRGPDDRRLDRDTRARIPLLRGVVGSLGRGAGTSYRRTALSS